MQLKHISTLVYVVAIYVMKSYYGLYYSFVLLRYLLITHRYT